MRDAEAAFETALASFKAAKRAWDKRKTAANVAAFTAASAALDTAAAAFQAEQDAAARADLRARRLALVAPRRELRSRQMTFIF